MKLCNLYLVKCKIIKILFLLSLAIGIFNIAIYYNFASKLNFQYSNIKNKFSDDNKYLAMVTQSGLWIKDEIDGKTLLIKSELIKENILSETIINEFNDNFELIRLSENNIRWKYYNYLGNERIGSIHWSRYLDKNTNFDWIESFNCN